MSGTENGQHGKIWDSIVSIPEVQKMRWFPVKEYALCWKRIVCYIIWSWIRWFRSYTDVQSKEKIGSTLCRDSLFSTRTGLHSLGLFLQCCICFNEVIYDISWCSISVHLMEVNMFFCVNFIYPYWIIVCLKWDMLKWEKTRKY